MPFILYTRYASATDYPISDKQSIQNNIVILSTLEEFKGKGTGHTTNSGAKFLCSPYQENSPTPSYVN